MDADYTEALTLKDTKLTLLSERNENKAL